MSDTTTKPAPSWATLKPFDTEDAFRLALSAYESEDDDIINDLAYHLARQDPKVKALVSHFLLYSIDFMVRMHVYNTLRDLANGAGGDVPDLDLGPETAND